MQNYFMDSQPWGMFQAGTAAVVLVLAIWSLIWKALALWRAARIGSKPWFVVLLLVNTFGILEILYLYVFSKKSSNSVNQPVQM